MNGSNLNTTSKEDHWILMQRLFNQVITYLEDNNLTENLDQEKEYIDHGEWLLAHENLCSIIDATENLRLNTQTLHDLKELDRLMNVSIVEDLNLKRFSTD